MGETNKSTANTVQGGQLGCLKLTNEFILKSYGQRMYVWIYMCICVHVYAQIY